MIRINCLTRQDAVTAADLFPIWSGSNQDTRAVTAAAIATYLATLAATNDGKVTQYASPSASPFTVAITDSSASAWLKLTPTAGFAAGTITLPAVANCVDRQEILVTTSQAVTALTVAGNGATAVTGAPTTLAANAIFMMRFDALAKDWTRVR